MQGKQIKDYLNLSNKKEFSISIADSLAKPWLDKS